MRAFIVACAALVTLLTAGCTGDGQDSHRPGSHRSGPESSSPSSSPAPGAVPSTISPSQAVEQVLLNAADVPPGSVIDLVPEGDQVEGQPTLDECGYRFSSEAMRVARRQVSVRYPDAGTGSGEYSNEVVAYDTAAHAELALKEWRSAVQNCPDDEYRHSTVAGIPPVRAKLLEFHQLDSLPVPNNSVARQLVSTRAGRSLYVAVIYMQHGELLDANYLTTSGPPTEAQVARLTRQAQKTGARLVALPGGTQA